MRIDCLVTIEAASGGIAELYILRMTAIALRRLVSVPKLEIRKCMIECLAVEQDDVGISPFMISVTPRAFLLRRVGLTPVKSFSRPTIGCSFFVACKA